MKGISLPLVAALVLSVGCSKSSGSSAPLATAQALSSGNVTATAPLTTVKTGEAIPSTFHNYIKLSGQGTQAQYHAMYTFNSGNNSAFKIMDVGSTSNCSASDGSFSDQTSYYLSSQQGSTEITMLDPVDLQPNTDYTLEIRIASQNCSGQLDLTFDVLAWADVATTGVVNPQRAKLCSSSGPKDLLFFVGFTPMEAIGADSMTLGDGWSGANLAPYMSSSELCGTKVQLSSEQIESFGDNQTVTATTPAGTTYQEKITFDETNGSGTITCSEGKTTYANLTMSNCTNVIADQTMMQNLPQ